MAQDTKKQDLQLKDKEPSKPEIRQQPAKFGLRSMHSNSRNLSNKSETVKPQSPLQSTAASTVVEDSTFNPNQHSLNLRFQPSKIFISKCRAELEALLIAIKDTYHDEFKKLYHEEIHSDLFLKIGEEDLKKSLHRCFIASRAHKFYKSLKAFKVDQIPIEKDIIIREFQEKINLDSTGEEIANSTTCKEGKEEEEEEVAIEISEESILQCNLPFDIFSPDLLLNFFRRVYLDQDIAEEELQLNQRLIEWLKINRPELIKVPPKHSPDHRESFRTIQPDFDEMPLPKNNNMASEKLIDFNNEGDADYDDQDDNSQSISLTGSLLTRTETFELLTKSNPDNSQVSNLCNNAPSEQPDDDKSELSVDVSASEQTNTSYAPTTRTGLKPKTFTTPVEMRGIKTRPRLETETKPIATSTRTSLVKQQPQAPTATKRSSLTPKSSETSQESVPSRSVTKVKGTLVGAIGNKSKPTIITRAHPISIERSQSPSTSVIKGTTRNFIAANKRLISQMEKKPIASAETPSVEDSEVEVNDMNSILMPLTTDNLAANMDKFSLVSYSKLAEALAGMFIDGLLADTIIHVKDEKQIKAHKCILASRSAHLADILSKQNLPSTMPESIIGTETIKINLTDFSYSTVYFSMMHIYSGNVKVPDDLDIDELAKLAHHLHVTTLTQVCLQNLRMNYCHFFHKPCNVCCVGVIKTLPLAWRYDYTELYSKCLHWIGSHFANIFCLKEFSELKPHDLLEECYAATLSQLNPDNIIPKTIECQKLLKNLPRVKWTESIICLVGRLLEDFCHYVADNYEKILQSESFTNLSKNFWECEVLEENLLAAMNHLKPDSGCKTLIQLHKIECSYESYCDDPNNASDSFVNLITKLRKYCERYLLKEATSVVHCSSWRYMSPSLQKRIKDQAIISSDFDEPTRQLASKPRLPSMIRNQQQANISPRSSSHDVARSPSNRSTPDPKIKSPSTTYLPPPKNKTAAARHVKVLK